jgi:hypothetical protein
MKRSRAAKDATIATFSRRARLLADAEVNAKELTKLRSVLRLARELCDAVDAAAEDIGGCRPTSQILSELGPAVDACSTSTKGENHG